MEELCFGGLVEKHDMLYFRTPNQVGHEQVPLYLYNLQAVRKAQPHSKGRR
jgi:hypothetical protein